MSTESTDWPFDQDAPEATAPNVAEFTVSELSQALKRTVEDTFGHVRVRGELGRVSRPASGHLYLDLKDDKAVLAGVVWKGVARGLRIQPEQGLEVVVTGKLTTYPGQSKYQLVIESMEPAGVGALMALLEERRKKLEAEGLFDPARKQLPPYLPRVIGVITSPSGAVIRDIMHRIADRFPSHILVWPVRVQGEQCVPEVAAGIRGFNALDKDDPVPRPDLIIVARGGGSLEDLWGFNDEDVVRAAAESDIPLISAVGHETDWTLIDHAADERAPTPSAAAERAVPVRADLAVAVNEYGTRLQRGLLRMMSEAKSALRSAARGLPKLADILALPRQRFDMAAGRLATSLQAAAQRARTSFVNVGARLSPQPLRAHVARSGDQTAKLAARLRPALDRALVQRRSALDGQAKLLATLGYRSVLGRGYALIHGPDGVPVRSIDQAMPGLDVEVEFHDGRAPARFGTGDAAPAPKPAARKAKPKPSGGGQGSLF